MKIKKSKIFLMSRLTAIMVFGAMLPVVMPYHDKCINKVYAEGHGAEFYGELDASAVEAFCLNPKYCFYIHSDKKMLVIPSGVESIAPGTFFNLPKDIEILVIPGTVKNFNSSILEDTGQNRNGNVKYIFVSPDCKYTGNFNDIKISKCFKFGEGGDEEFGQKLTYKLVDILSLNPRFAPHGKDGDIFIIPSSVSEVESGAFNGWHGNFTKIISTSPVEFQNKGASEIDLLSVMTQNAVKMVKIGGQFVYDFCNFILRPLRP